MVIVAILIFAGCFSKILIIMLYNKFYEDSFKVADCKSELIKLIKLRYGNQIKLGLPIQDAGMFVSRYIYQYSKLIKSINVVDMLGLIAMLIGIAVNYEKQFFETSVWSIAMFIYVSLGLLVGGERKERIIISNISDYLVNNMNIRTTAKEHRVQAKENLKAMTGTEDMDNVVNTPKTNEIGNTGNEAIAIKGINLSGRTREENNIIEEVLREFLEA